jgi:transmembrane sensor
MQPSQISELLWKFLNQSITPEEQKSLEEWVEEQPGHQAYFDKIRSEEFLKVSLRQKNELSEPDDDKYIAALQRRLHESIRETSQDRQSKPQRGVVWRWLPYAAAVLIGISLGVLFFRNDKPSATVVTQKDITPGGNRATLTLVDGRVISLDETQEGIIVGEDYIGYQRDSSQVIAWNSSEETHDMLTLTTPRGGTYQITLPDGTRVWLNAASTLKYPSRFRGNERIVELSGEGFFAVTKSVFRGQKFANQPFKVVSGSQVVEVLGTQFNISNYLEDKETLTTLVEGKVNVSAGLLPDVMLKPGQQTRLKNGKLMVNDVNVAPIVAWKSGMFHFREIPFEELMHQIERWYDVDVVYKSRIPQETFSGRMRRDVSLFTVLNLLKASEIKFRVEGKRLIIE